MLNALLDHDIDLKRGGLIAGQSHLPQSSANLSAKLIWLDRNRFING